MFRPKVSLTIPSKHPASKRGYVHKKNLSRGELDARNRRLAKLAERLSAEAELEADGDLLDKLTAENISSGEQP